MAWGRNICADVKDKSDEMPLIAEQMESTNNVYPMQTFPMTSSSKGGHNEASSDEEGEVDTVIQDYIDQVAATNLKQRRASFAETTELAALAIPDHHYPRSGSNPPALLPSSGNLSISGSRNTVRFSPTSGDASSVQSTPRGSALKKVSQIPEPAQEPEPQLPAEVEASILLDSDIESQKQTVKSERELVHAKKLLRLAFVEFYRGLGLLSNYRFSRCPALPHHKCKPWHVETY